MPRTLTFFSPMGWRAGPPVRDGDLLETLPRAEEDGGPVTEFDGGSVHLVDFNNLGLTVLAEIAGMPVAGEDNLPAMGPEAAFVRGAGAGPRRSSPVPDARSTAPACTSRWATR